LGAAKIVAPGDFVVTCGAFDANNINAKHFKQPRVIGKFLTFEFLMGIKDGRKVKPLWGLRPMQAFTRDGA